jgi:hypothetical protein
MLMGAPVLAQHFQGALREWYVAVFVSLPVPNMDEHPITIYVSDLQMHPFLRAQTTAIDRAQTRSVTWTAYALQDPTYFDPAEHDRQLLLSRSTR